MRIDHRVVSILGVVAFATVMVFACARPFFQPGPAITAEATIRGR